MLKTLILDLKKFNLNDNIKNLFSSDMDSLSVDNLTEITDFITSITSYL